MNEHVDYQAKEAGGSTKFLWWCAGADPLILKYSSYSDHVKYAGIGGVVLATGFLAALSMGFAMHTVFGDAEGNGNLAISLPIGIIWGLIVFNLDRFIVSSTGKGDGESSIGRKEFFNALPRILMALLLGITIAAPLETYIFKTEIEREWGLAMDELAFVKKFEIQAIEKQKNENIREKVDKLEKEAQDQQIRVNELQKVYNDEITGKTGPRGVGREANAIKKELDRELLKLSGIETERDSLRSLLSINEEEIEGAIQSTMESIKSSKPGFLDQLIMLERLSHEGKEVPEYDPATGKIIEGKFKEIYGSAFWPIWLVRLLFMIVEIAPVLLKLMLIKSPYDYMSENVNQILETKQGISIVHLKDDESKIHKLKRNHNPERIISIIEHQNIKETENAKEAITAYAEKEKEEIRKNPDDFIQPTT
jgi:hypothetical protein